MTNASPICASGFQKRTDISENQTALVEGCVGKSQYDLSKSKYKMSVKKMQDRGK